MNTPIWTLEKDKKRKRVLAFELARNNSDLFLGHRSEKYKKMTDSPFAFYRGSAHIFYRDLAARNLIRDNRFVRDNTVTWVQGDLHIENFGAFCNQEGDIVFDLNDFDESWVACYLYDVWRGAVSLVLSGLTNGFPESQIEQFIDAFSVEYLDELERARGKEGNNLDKVTKDNTHGVLQNFLLKVEKKSSRKAMLDAWTVLEDQRRRFDLDNPKLGAVTEDDQQLIVSAVTAYRHHLTSSLKDDQAYFEVQDVALRLKAGLGSLGTPRYYVLIQGASQGPDTCRVLDLKQQSLPSFFPFLPEVEKQKLLAVYDEYRAGCRVAHAQKAMLMDPDPHLGCVSLLGRSFSVRERSPAKKSLKLKKLFQAEDFHEMAHHWGTILAAGHARADKDYSDVLVPHNFEDIVTDHLAGQREAFREEVRAFAFSYARQVVRDHALMTELLKKDKLM